MNTKAFVFYDLKNEKFLNFDFNSSGLIMTKHNPETIHPYEEYMFVGPIENLVNLCDVESWRRFGVNKDDVVIIEIEYDSKNVYVDYDKIVWEGKDFNEI